MLTYVRVILFACAVLAFAGGAIFEGIGILGFIAALFLADALLGRCWQRRQRPPC